MKITLDVDSKLILGKVDWIYDREIDSHIPCCPYWITFNVKCGNGPLTNEQIKTGHCENH